MMICLLKNHGILIFNEKPKQVAKESADVIVLDDNFTTIVDVAKWGRAVYTNIQKFVQFQLTVNVAALVISFLSACISGMRSSMLSVNI